MRRLSCLLTAAALLWVFLTSVGLAEESPVKVVLKDGQEFIGQLIREDENALFLRTEDGEERGIARVRIDRVIKAAVHQPEALGSETPAQTEARKKWLAENRALLDELKDLGEPSREKRRTALDRVTELGKRAEPLLLGMLHPKEKMPVDTRLGALRGLAVLGVLSPEGAQSLAWVAMKDSDFEVRREACRTIRLLGDDRAVGSILQSSVSEDGSTQRAAAWALRELDDVRAFAALVSALPGPEVSSSMPSSSVTPQGEWRELPAGPYGEKMPVFMPQQQQAVAGTATVGHPASDALKLITGKNLGSSPGVWHYWLRQKIGALSREDIEGDYQKRSVRNRMNAQ